MFERAMRCMWVVCAAALAQAEPQWGGLWARGGSLQFAVESVTQLNEAARRDGALGWRLDASLAVSASHCAPPDEALLLFELSSPRLQLRGAARDAEWAARPSVWDEPAAQRSAFAAHWADGELTLLLPPADPPHLADYKRALASLFQLRPGAARNETDASGRCAVLYETLSPTEFRKIKTECTWAGAGAAEDAAAAGVESRRVTRYEWGAGAGGAPGTLLAVHAEEQHELGAAPAAVKARGYTRLTLRRELAAPRCAAAAPGLAAPLAALAPALRPADLQLSAAAAPPDEDEEEEAEDEDEEDAGDSEDGEHEEEGADGGAGGAGGAGDALEAAWRAAGAGGGAGAARAALRLLPVLRAASAPRLAALLRRQLHAPALTELARAMGAAGSAAGCEAAVGVLGAADAGAAADRALVAYLEALAVARAPAAAAVRRALRLADEARPALREPALLAAAAAARRRPELSAELRDHLMRRLARCKESACRATVLTALGNLGAAEAAEPLLAAAEGARGQPELALAALRALAQLPLAALPYARVNRLIEIGLDGAAALEVRGAALELAVAAAADTPFALSGAARRLAASGAPHAHELRRVLWGRLRLLAERSPAAAQFLRAAAADPALGSWHAMAHAGTSEVLSRALGWAAAARAAALDASLLAAGGALRRGVVTLGLSAAAAPPQPALQLELWARGLGAMAGGGEPDAAEAEEEAAAGLRLAVAGAQLAPITLFTGQAELLGHVWAGTGSAPTPVLRALCELGAARAVLPLPTGAAAALSARAAAALALDARAAVSLWSRTASTRLTLRAAAAGAARARLAAPWGRVRVRSAAELAPRLRIAADLDFYRGVSLCVRAESEPHALAAAARLRSELGARRWAVRRRRRALWGRPPRSLALGRLNDAACRALPPAGDDDD